MNTKSWAIGLLALSTVTVATPSLAQDIRIGPDGVRIMEPRDRDRRDDRRDEYRRGISEREAVRIARREGLREVDAVRGDRRVYRVIGADRRGRDIRVDVDRRTGDVIAVR